MTSLVGCGTKLAKDEESPKPSVDEVADDEQIDDDSLDALATSDIDDSITSTGLRYYTNHFFTKGPGGYIYFHAPDPEGGMDKAVIGASYISIPSGAANTLYRYKTGSDVECVWSDNAYGTIGYDGKDLYYQSYVEYDDDNYYDAIVVIDNGDADASEVSRDGKFVITTDEMSNQVLVCDKLVYDGSETLMDMTVYNEGKSAGHYSLEGYSDCLGLINNQLYYTSYRDEGYYIEQLSLKDGLVTELGLLPVPEDCYSGPYGECQQFAIDDDNIYLGYNFYEGSGHYYYGGFFVTAKIGQADSISFVDNGVYDNMPPAFAVVDGKMQPVDGVPGRAGVEGDYIGYYDQDGNWNPVKDGYETRRIGADEEGLACVEYCEYIDGKIYLVYNESVHEPDSDIGWREAFRRTYVKVAEIDCASGSEHIILEIR